MIKNEIEYMHSKIDGISSEDDLVDKINDNGKKFEKIYTMGEDGKRFKVIVEHGELYIECIDSFEEIFEVNRELLEKVEITNILDPYMFQNHKEIANALFEVYFEIGN